MALTAIVGALAMAGISSIGIVKAQSTNGNFPPVIQKLVEKFNLDTVQVQQVLDENRQEKQAQNQVRYNEILDKAIAEGKITEDQKILILAKQEELKQKMDSLKDLSREEKQAEMEKIMDDMKIWRQDNNINFGFMGRGFIGDMSHLGFKGPGNKGFWPKQ